MTKVKCGSKTLNEVIPKEKLTETVFGPSKDPVPFRPSPTGLVPEEVVQKIFQTGLIGERSIESPNASHLTNVVNLIGMFYLQTENPIYEGRTGRFKVQSTGWHIASPGNASGGSWESVYRYFCIQKDDGEHNVISFAIVSSKSEQTMLIVAVERNGGFHNSLQLDLDKFLTYSGNTMYIWHNGALTCGKKGSVKRDVVIEFVREKAPHLLGAGKIKLGSLPTNRLITWEDAELLIYNCIEYALIRDELRKDYA